MRAPDGPRPRDGPFVGRAEELKLAAASAAQVLDEGGRLLWIEGEPGSGKSRLARRITEQLPSSFSVLRAEADEHESDEVLSLVSQLGPITSRDGFAAGVELLGILNECQRDGPVSVVVEDLHWADVTSRRALLTTARRLRGDRVLLIVTTRPETSVTDGWERYRLDPERCQCVSLGGLTTADVGELARQVGMPMAQRDVDRLHRHTNGHPLHVRTLLSELTPEQLAAADVGLPAPRSLASATIARLADLSPEARALVSAMAVVNGRAPLRTVGHVAAVSEPTRALGELLPTGFVTWRSNDVETPIEFSHPLYRAAVYDDLSPTRRQALHRAAAGVLDGTAALEHRVASTDGVDDQLSQELVDVVERERGSRSLAAKFLLWASSLSSARPRQEHHLLGAARFLLADGQTTRAAELRPRLEACEDGPLRSLVLGVLAYNQSDFLTAERWLLRVASQVRGDSTDKDLLAAALARLSTLYCTHSRGVEAQACATQALSLGASDRHAERVAWVGLGFGEAISNGAAAGLARLAERLPQDPDDVEPEDVDLLVTRGALRAFAGRTEPAIADLRAVLRRARDGWRVAQLTRAHLHLSQLLFSRGEWDEALVHAHVSLSLVADEGLLSMRAQVHAVLAAQNGARGEWKTAQEHTESARSALSDYRVLGGVIMTQVAAATIAWARGDPDGVIAALSPLTATGDVLASFGWWPMFIAALVEHGDLDAAELRISELAAMAEKLKRDLQARIDGLRARLALARGELDAALSYFERGIGLVGPDDPLLERAALHHEFGRFLHARGRRRGAVDQLRDAHDLLARVGAEPFLRRVEEDLLACGIRSDARAKRSPLDLTDREQDVVALVCKGMTNREVAAQLYISAKAVEYHLRNVYGKLGVRSRRELRLQLPS